MIEWNKLLKGIQAKTNRSPTLRFLVLFSVVAVLASVILPAFAYDFSVKRPAIGVEKVAAIAVQFPDKPPSSTIVDLRRRIFEEMDDYYQNISYGKMNITGDIVSTWVFLPHDMSYYGNYNGMNAHSEGAQTLIRDALEGSVNLMGDCSSC